MKYEGVSSDSDTDDEKIVDDKSRQGFSPAPPSFKRRNVIAITPGQASTAGITMPSPRGIMQVQPGCDLHVMFLVMITCSEIPFIGLFLHYLRKENLRL